MNYTRLTKTEGDRALRTGHEEIVFRLYKYHNHSAMVYDARGVFARATQMYEADGVTMQNAEYYSEGTGDPPQPNSITSWGPAARRMIEDITRSFCARGTDGKPSSVVMKDVRMTYLRAAVDAIVADAEDILFGTEARGEWSMAEVTYPLSAVGDDTGEVRLGTMKFEIVRTA
jgi:hypothetical protein